MSLEPCKTCRFCVKDPPPAPIDVTSYAALCAVALSRCRREPPVSMRGSDRAIWPVVDPNGPGCGKHRLEGDE